MLINFMSKNFVNKQTSYFLSVRFFKLDKIYVDKFLTDKFYIDEFRKQANKLLFFT